MEYIKNAQEMFYQDRIGRVYGCFEVTNVEFDSEKRKQLWTLRCIHCGFEKQTYNGKDYVKGKNHGICKCQHTKVASPKNPKKIKRPKLSDHALYSRWRSIKSRCCNPNDKDYPNYGGRGIGICDEWANNFLAFVDWANENGYEPSLTIDRKDNNKGYSPENCHWISRADQNKNKRNIPLFDGKTLPDLCKDKDLSYRFIQKSMSDGYDLQQSEIRDKFRKERHQFNAECRSKGADPDTVIRRMKRGLSFEEACSLSIKIGKSVYRLNGEMKPLKEWCEEYGISVPAVSYRMKNLGMSFEEAITTEKKQGRKMKDIKIPTK